MLNDLIALKCNRHRGSDDAAVPGKLRSDWNSLNRFSRLRVLTRSCGKTSARLVNTSPGWRHMRSKAYQRIEANNKETIRALCITAYMCWRSTSSGMTSPHKGMAQRKVCAYHDVSMLYTDASLLVKRHAAEITILQTIYSNAFSWMKILSVWLESH